MCDKYYAFNLSGDSPNPKMISELITNLQSKINILTDEIVKTKLSLGIDWAIKNNINAPKIENENEYYRLGISFEDGENIFSIQIWEKYYENIDRRKKNLFSNSNLDLGNDESTIIIE